MRKIILIFLSLSVFLLVATSVYAYPIVGNAKLQEFTGKVEFFNDNYITVSNITNYGLKQIVVILINSDTLVYGDINKADTVTVVYRIIRRAHQKHKKIAEEIYSHQEKPGEEPSDSLVK